MTTGRISQFSMMGGDARSPLQGFGIPGVRTGLFALTPAPDDVEIEGHHRYGQNVSSNGLPADSGLQTGDRTMADTAGHTLHA